MATAETALERAEDLAERVLAKRTARRRMLVIVNPYATTVSDRLRNLVVYALGGRCSVEAVETRADPTPPTCAARRPPPATTWSSPLAATGQSTRRPTTWPARWAATVQRHRQVEGFPGVRDTRVTAVGDASFPLEVDGDYLGERDEAIYSVRPGGLAVVA